jgi:hypothetical protein
MTTSADEIVCLYDDRRSELGQIFEQAREIERITNGEFTVPLPELDQDEKPAVPNLVLQGIEQHGMRIASTIANLSCAPLRPGIKKSEDLAATRKRAILGWWDANELDIAMHRRARWLITYASAPVQIRPDPKRGIPQWVLRKPLHTFPARRSTRTTCARPTASSTSPARGDGCRPTTRTRRSMLYRRPERVRRDTLFTLIEYVDGDETVLVAVGDNSKGGNPSVIYQGANGRGREAYGGLVLPSTTGGWEGSEYAVELERMPNRAGVCPAVVPGRITVDRPQGQFDGMVGLFQMQAKLMALEVNAVARDVYPDTWIVYPENGNGQILVQADGLAGVVGEIKGGTIQAIHSQPGYMTTGTIDRLERAQRQNALIPAEFGGESTTNVRTGRRGDAILSAVVDFPTQEAQKVLARSQQHETRVGIAISKGWFGPRKLSFYVNWRGATGHVDYVPAEIFEDDGETVTVNYAYPGTDLNGQTIRTGQKLGVGLISTQTARENDPEIEDPEVEHDRIISEELERHMLTALGQLAESGAMAPADLARIRKLVRTNQMELEEAVDTVHREAQERQATSGEPGTPAGPVPAGSPEAQPGIAVAGQGAEAGTIAQPPPGVDHLAQLLQSLRSPQRSLPSEQTSAAAVA